jgi:hypothetical protein
MRLFIKSMANTWPALFARCPVNRPIPDPSSTIDLPLMGGSKDRICHGKHRSQIFRFVVHSLNYAWCSVSAIGRPGQGSRRMSMENINSESRGLDGKSLLPRVSLLGQAWKLGNRASSPLRSVRQNAPSSSSAATPAQLQTSITIRKWHEVHVLLNKSLVLSDEFKSVPKHLPTFLEEKVAKRQTVLQEIHINVSRNHKRSKQGRS